MENTNLATLLNQYQNDINVIMNESNTFYLVNAGRMNHGKSSLLNSLTGNIDDYFEVQDKRTTVKNKEYKYDKNTIFIDTPGLNADENDDKEAIKAYKKASLIVFVHNLAVGDIRKEEINDIKTIISCFYSVKSLEERFILVLTGKDAISSTDDLQNIKDKLLSDIKQETGLSNFKVFEVSNTTFKKGLKSKKVKLQEYSGVVALKKYIEEYIDKNKHTINNRILERIDIVTENTKSVIESNLKTLKESLSQKEKAMNFNIDKMNNFMDSRFYLIQRANERIDLCNQQIKDLKNSL